MQARAPVPQALCSRSGARRGGTKCISSVDKGIGHLPCVRGRSQPLVFLFCTPLLGPIRRCAPQTSAKGQQRAILVYSTALQPFAPLTPCRTSPNP